MITVGLTHFLIIGAALFVLGMYAVLTRRSSLMLLMGIQLILSAAALNFAAFSKYSEIGISGQVTTFFIIMIAIAEISVASAIVLNMYRDFKRIDIQEVNRLRD